MNMSITPAYTQYHAQLKLFADDLNQLQPFV